MFLGRSIEIEKLTEPNWRDRARLIVVHGRRRVGKTALIHHAYNKETIWKFEGIECATETTQIEMFMHRLREFTGKPDISASNWNDAFHALNKALEGKKIIVFFDEFQWMAEMRPSLVSLFKYYWDNHFQKHKKCTFVICGSVSSFIVKNVIRSRALYGRIDTELSLKPLSLPEIRQMLSWAPEQDVIEYAMTFGGIPEYLLALNPALSYMQNLDSSAFCAQGYFFEEFNRLFISHFSQNPHYQNVVSVLGRGTHNADGLAKACHTKTGGSFSQVLDNLALAGFIEKYQPLGKALNSKLLRYRLADEYLHFYFDFILPNAPALLKGDFKFHHISSNRLQQWQGYAFERLCRKQSALIADILRFSGVSYVSGSWFGARAKGKPQKNAAQIDLLFQRRDRVLTLCEAKYTSRLQGQAIIRELEQKIEILQQNFPNFSIQRVLILGKKITMPDPVKRAFDRILFAGDFV